MKNDLTVIRGSTFFVSDARGDVAGRGAEGLFAAHVRHLSVWELLIDDEPRLLLGAAAFGYGRAHVYGTLGAGPLGHDPAVSIRRERRVLTDVHEHVSIRSHSDRHLALEVDLRFATDFVDIFEARWSDLGSASATGGRSWTERDGDRLLLCHSQERFTRTTEIAFDAPPELVEERARWHVRLAPRARWDLSIRISCRGDGIERSRGSARRREDGPQDSLASAPALETTSGVLEQTYQRSIADLGALTLPGDDPDAAGAPAAGLPW